MMKARQQIYILSGPIQSGKTSLLQSWIKSGDLFGGFLSPDSSEGRILYFPSLGESISFQKKEGDSNTLQIGRFFFDKSAFDLAAQRAIQDIKNGKKFLILDEIGKLELEQKIGFYSLLIELIHLVPQYPDCKLILVVRESLLHLAKQISGLEKAVVFTKEAFENQLLPRWIILAGGESKRMGSPKALLNYHGIPQYQFLQKQVKKLGQLPLLSLAFPNQLATSEIEFIFDLPHLEPSGPMGALLSYHEHYPFAGAYLLACDMPNIGLNELNLLLQNQSNQAAAACSDYGPEPLFAYYSLELLSKIPAYHRLGEQSLRRILLDFGFKVVNLPNPSVLTSIDTVEQAENWRKHE